MESQKTTQLAKGLRSPWHHGAHSGSRSGIEDYNDGGGFTHYLGNDDFSEVYDEGENLDPDTLDGHEAQGNDVLEEDIDFSSIEKRHSGL